MSHGTRIAAAVAALALAAAPARAAIIVDSSDPRCISLPGPFPPGLDRLEPPGSALALVASFSPAVAVPVDFASQPPEPAAPGPFSDLRSAIAADACNGARDPQIDGVTAASPTLGLLTGSSCEGVAFLDPATGQLRTATVATPATFSTELFPYLPAPGASDSRVALSTRACVAVEVGTLDSKGVPVPNGCRPGKPSYYANFTSGAAVAAGRLFVSTANLGAGAGSLDPQFLPGTVLVFTLGEDPLAASPDPATPWLFTSAFNPTHVTAYTTPSGRELVLVGQSGALGLVADDPMTPYREAGGAALSEAAIDVIDAEQLRLIATIPLGLAGLSFERLGIDENGRVALIGSAIARHVYAVDLAPLDALAPADPFVRLDGEEGRPAAAIFDAADPLVLPGLADGAPPETCPGYVVGVEFGRFGNAYATDFCDGTITRIRVATGAPEVPLAPARVSLHEQIELVAPVGPDSLGLPQAPGALRVFASGDARDRAAVIVGQPEGLACSIAVPAPGGAALAAAAALTLTTLAARRARRGAPRSSPEEDTT